MYQEPCVVMRVQTIPIWLKELMLILRNFHGNIGMNRHPMDIHITQTKS